MSCGCDDNSNGAYYGLCNTDTPYPSVSAESVPSLISNLTYALYGQIQKDVSSGVVKWIIPCDPNNSLEVPGYPRNEAGLLCYLLTVAAGIVGQNVLATASAPKTFTTADLGATWLISATSTPTVTLPQLTTGSLTNRRKPITIYNASVFNLTIAVGVGNTITPAWDTPSYSTFILQSNDTVTLTAQDDTSSLTWFATGGNATLSTTSQFAGIPKIGSTTSGFQYLPTGLLLVWGTASFSVAGVLNTYPAAFPNACLGAVQVGQWNNARIVPVGDGKTQFTGTATVTTTGFFIAIGY